MKKLTLVAIAACLAACATVKYNGAQTTVSKVDYPEVGVVTIANVGDELVKKGTISQEKVLVIKQAIKGGRYVIPAGTYKQLGWDGYADYYAATGVVAGFMADPANALHAEKKPGGKLGVVTVMGALIQVKGPFERQTRYAEQADSQQQTLLYNGRVGNKINIGYREFSNNLARPAFSNEVEYDLSTSNVIGYKGAQIEVISADNSTIKYKLLKNFP